MFCSLGPSPYLVTHLSKTSIEVNGNLVGKRMERWAKIKIGIETLWSFKAVWFLMWTQSLLFRA